MTEDDVRTVFGLKSDTIKINGNVIVDVSVFASLFKDAPTNPTYDDLIEIDGGRLGYIPFLDELKDEGILD